MSAAVPLAIVSSVLICLLPFILAFYALVTTWPERHHPRQDHRRHPSPERTQRRPRRFRKDKQPDSRSTTDYPVYDPPSYAVSQLAIERRLEPPTYRSASRHRPPPYPDSPNLEQLDGSKPDIDNVACQATALNACAKLAYATDDLLH